MITKTWEGWTVWGEIVVSVLTGVAGIVTAVGGLLAARSRQVTADLAVCMAARVEAEKARSAAEQDFRAWRLAAYRYMRQLESLTAVAGISVPDRPDVLLS